jgi:3-methyl-2-oxobutanoate hydroxymethyltransferase
MMQSVQVGQEPITSRDSAIHTPRKVTPLHLKRWKNKSELFSMLTAYDYSTARLLDEAGTDVLLVGDSLAMTVLGHSNTLSVTVDEMLHHVKAVRRGTSRALLVADMPFMSYHISLEESLRNAGRFIQEGGADAVKLEGATPEILETVQRLTAMGIPVVGHLGLMPQHILALGGFRIQATTAYEAHKLLLQAQALENAGCFAIVLELMPLEVAQAVTQHLDIPTIGIGAGPHCNAQVLVVDDILARFGALAPRFVRRYADVGTLTREAAQHFREDVQQGHYPGTQESTEMNEDEYRLFQDMIRI